jgi:hypothetical protein
MTGEPPRLRCPTVPFHVPPRLTQRDLLSLQLSGGTRARSPGAEAAARRGRARGWRRMGASGGGRSSSSSTPPSGSRSASASSSPSSSTRYTRAPGPRLLLDLHFRWILERIYSILKPDSIFVICPVAIGSVHSSS